MNETLELYHQQLSNFTEVIAWKTFLESSVQFYKYQPESQVLIYAQNPKSKAVASFGIWKDQMNRVVKSGTKGIKLFDNNYEKFKYVFDVSDTVQLRGKEERSLFEWRLNDDNKKFVSARLKKCFGTESEDIVGQIKQSVINQTHSNSASLNYAETLTKKGYRNLVARSVLYKIAQKSEVDLGVDALDLSDVSKLTNIEDLQNFICEVSVISKEILHSIEISVKEFEKQRQQETVIEDPVVDQLVSDNVDLDSTSILPKSLQEIESDIPNEQVQEQIIEENTNISALEDERVHISPEPIFFVDFKDVEPALNYNLYDDGDVIGYNKDGVEYKIGKTEGLTYTVTKTRISPLGEVLGHGDIPPNILQQIRDYHNGVLEEVQEAPNEESRELLRAAQATKINYRITDGNLGQGGAKAKYQYNISAIRTLQVIESEIRLATPEEQETLSKYVGWGGIAQAFDPENEHWEKEYQELKELLSPEEYESARASTLNAHYTSPAVIHAVYQAVERMGFKGGNILEPSMGIGNFFGMMPETMANNSRLYGVELDNLTGRIAKQLYQKATIEITGYENSSVQDNFFDLAIGNVPFGSYSINDPKYNKQNLYIHDYFFSKTLDKVKPNGVIAFITSKGTLDKSNTTFRKYLAERAELLGAIRLPNNTFKGNAGTEVTTDIIFLKKRDRVLEASQESWIYTGIIQSYDAVGEDIKVPVNEYYVQNPNMLLGKMQFDRSMYGNEKETALVPLSEPTAPEKINRNYNKIIESNEFTPYQTRWLEAFKNVIKEKGCIIKEDLNRREFRDMGGLRSLETYIFPNYEEIFAKLNSYDDIKVETDFQKAFEKAFECLPVDIVEVTQQLVELGDEAEVLPADPRINNLAYGIVENEVYFREQSTMSKPNLPKNQYKRLKGIVVLRDTLKDVINAQLEDISDEEIKEKQQTLNTQYDQFVKEYGLINSNENRRVFEKDSSYFLLCSLEILDASKKKAKKADIFTKRTIQKPKKITSVDNANDALAVSMAEKGYVDIDFMMQLSDFNKEKLVEELYGRIFRNHENMEIEEYLPADEYLSGYVRQKLRDVKALSEIHPELQVNVDFLENVQPKELTASEIEVRLGATWFDPRYIQQFVYEALETPNSCREDPQKKDRAYRILVRYSDVTGKWNISNKMANSSNVLVSTKYGTSFINAYEIIELTLNLKKPAIYEKKDDKQVLNKDATQLAIQKQDMIQEAFKDWIFKDVERRTTLVKIYNEKFNNLRLREYDGSHLSFPGMSVEFSMREHQRSAIARILYSKKNTLLAHEVGAGKTFEMITSAKESKRLGLCNKSLFVVPKHIINQFASEFIALYPSANLLVATEKDFETKNRKKFTARIATGDYDGVIIGHTQFEKLALSKERQERYIQEQVDEITEGIEELKRESGSRYSIKQMELTRKNLETKLEKITSAKVKDDVIDFEDLGVDRLFVDEAHHFKNLFFYTKMQNVAGLNASHAQKSFDMSLKCRYMDELTNGRGIIFATGTPISNSMSELYTMMSYLQADKLKELGLTQFDSWATMFGETVTATELAPEGTGYRTKTRFSKFYNLPELMNHFKEVADIKTIETLNLAVPNAHYETIVSKPSDTQKKLIQELSERAKAIQSGNIDPQVDNMLKITSDGRKIGLDQRLINPLLADDPNSKVNTCVENIYRIWHETAENKSTQLVFCDFSTPGGEGFNVYEDVKKKLIEKGIPEKEIEFIHNIKKDSDKKTLFNNVNEGKVRILMGSTQKMGAGTNCQKKLIALHDLDCPWRPADLEQRRGRIVRQGNENKEVHVYRYVTEATFDAYLYQMIENKQKFISQIMTSKTPVRSCEDFDEAVLSYAEIKALCAGNPLIKEKMDLDIEVTKLKMLKASHNNEIHQMEDKIYRNYPEQIKSLERSIKRHDADILHRNANTGKGEFSMEIKGNVYTSKTDAGEKLIEACKTIRADSQYEDVGSYRGFHVRVELDIFNRNIFASFKNEGTYRVELSTDPLGNITRINNLLDGLDTNKLELQEKLQVTQKQVELTKGEVTKPFKHEDLLNEKILRLSEITSTLSLERGGEGQESQEERNAQSKEIDSKEEEPIIEQDFEPVERESILAKLQSNKEKIEASKDSLPGKENGMDI